MKFGPEYVRKLIEEANLLMQDQNVDEQTKAAIWSCLQSVEHIEKGKYRRDVASEQQPS